MLQSDMTPKRKSSIILPSNSSSKLTSTKQMSPEEILSPLTETNIQLEELDEEDDWGPFENSWIAPGFNSMEMHEKLCQSVNSQGGPFDQAHLYVDHQSSADWDGIANNEEYMTAQHDIPLDDAVKAIKTQLESFPHLSQNAINIIALGPGGAQTEIVLAKKLVSQTPIKKVRLCLLDISQPLLSNARDHAERTLRGYPGVRVTACSGDFYQLHKYDRLTKLTKNNKRLTLVTMLGYTFGNLINERRFVLDQLNSFTKNTFFLMDLVVAFAPSDQREEIMKNDPWLSGESRWQKSTETFLEGPLRRYRKGLGGADAIQFSVKLDDDTRRTIPKSYCIEMHANLPDNSEFCMRFFKRYEINPFLKCMESDGWRSIDAWRFGQNQLLSLLKRK